MRISASVNDPIVVVVVVVVVGILVVIVVVVVVPTYYTYTGSQKRFPALEDRYEPRSFIVHHPL